MTVRNVNAPGGEPGAIKRDGGDTTIEQKSTARTATPAGFIGLLEEVAAGRYRPRPASVGDLLLRRHSEACRWHGARSLAVFAKAALRAEGEWWVVVLDAAPDTLDRETRSHVSDLWASWLAGVNPFRRRRGGAA